MTHWDGTQSESVRTKASGNSSWVSDSKAHFEQTHVLIKYLASGAHGFVFLAISKKDADEIYWRHADYCSEYYSDLRSKLVVVKFAKGKQPVMALNGFSSTPIHYAQNLRDEVNFLIDAFPAWKFSRANAPIAGLEDYHLDEDVQWMTQPFIAGGDLAAFVRKNRHELSLGLQWPIGRSIAVALAYLHFGVTDLDTTKPAHGWPHVSHNDLHCGNLFLQMPTANSFGNYPDIVIGDFGGAVKFPQGDHAKFFQKSQALDFKSFGTILYGMMLSNKHGKLCQMLHCATPKCQRWARVVCLACFSVASWRGFLHDLSEDEQLLAHQAKIFRDFLLDIVEGQALERLRTFIEVAMVQRELHYEPLSAAALQSLSSKDVSDAELRDTVGVVRSDASLELTASGKYHTYC